MWIAILLATLGVSIFLYFTKNFLGLNPAFFWDWDGLVERALLVYIIRTQTMVWVLVPLIILSRIIIYLIAHGHLEFLKEDEPGALFQRVKIKSEMLVDVIASPLIAVILSIYIP